MSFSAFVEEEQNKEVSQVWPNLQVPPLDCNIEKRIASILSRMTLQQKVGQIIQADTNSVTPQELKEFRLGAVLSGGNSAPGDLPYSDVFQWLKLADAYYDASVDQEGVEVAIPTLWGIDAVHGHTKLQGATVFPHNIGLGATGNPDLVEKIMEATARELIVSGHDWTFAPTLAVPRDDRWGRTYEGFSEDPEIVSTFADRVVWGLQGRFGAPNYFDETCVIASAKHFVGDGGTTDGIDQGDTSLSEEELAAIHAAGYYPALEAGVQTVMASFNSWNGKKMHGHRYMLTDVLKGRLGFNGFVIGDWNGHGQIPGCTNTECPDALLAGVDMYMAPDSWKGLYYSLLRHVENGRIPIDRLNDAVRRILRVKLTYGLFDKARPSQRLNAGCTSEIATGKHRKIARQAVQESLVLLKNNHCLLPLKPDKKIVVVGDGAHNISKQCGGWTLSWQGTGISNSHFPNGESILEGIRQIVEPNGGEIIHQTEVDACVDADVVIAIYGEEPYAEFKGDLDHLKYVSNRFDTSKLVQFNEAGIPIVSVFISGRPLWVTPEINCSTAFIVAWLPGSEGGGIADVLFQVDSELDFKGRLSFSWPASATHFDNNVGEEDNAPLFPVGYGLTYASSTENISKLNEESGIDGLKIDRCMEVFTRGTVQHLWKANLVTGEDQIPCTDIISKSRGLNVSRVDYLTQEDALLLDFKDENSRLVFEIKDTEINCLEFFDQKRNLALKLKSGHPISLNIELECIDGRKIVCLEEIGQTEGEWVELKIPIGSFSKRCVSGVKFSGISISSKANATVGLANVRFEEN